MTRRPGHMSIVAMGTFLLILLPNLATAQVLPIDQPLPEVGFLHPDLADVVAGPCTVENEYEATIYGMEEGEQRYPGRCRRLRFAFGPIVVKPGENDALIEPVTIDKPAYDGYIVRFKPDLVRASDGMAPNTEDMHLHHATWLNASPSYGRGPFFASGEEKTIATFPEGYGLRVGALDTWLLLYMVHNDIETPEVVWLTYDIDYIPEAQADDLTGVKVMWLDVQQPGPAGKYPDDAPSTSANPVFNVQRGFGDMDPETGRRVCTWPKQNCARHDTYGQRSAHQGLTTDSNGQPFDLQGSDWTINSSVTFDGAGTIIGLGGHLHFGGIRDEVSLVRDGVEKLIHISDALYWSRDPVERAQHRLGGEPLSWDFVMTVTGAPDWKVRIRDGDIIRINAVVDSEAASWYENMGIVVALVAPDEPDAIDVFDDDVILDRGYPRRALIPEGPWSDANGWRPGPCDPDFTGELNGKGKGKQRLGPKRLCLRGMPTHGPMDESGNHTGGCPPQGCPELTYGDGQVTTDIFSAAFRYGHADLGVIPALGIPLVRKDEPVRLWNFDTVARVWHTYTRCAYPCTGSKDMAYPYPDGGRGDPNDVMDFDSSEIGYGTFFEPASGQIGGNKSPQQVLQDGLFSEFTPTEEGVYTFFCRIHRGMRGAFKVVE